MCCMCRSDECECSAGGRPLAPAHAAAHGICVCCCCCIRHATHGRPDEVAPIGVIEAANLRTQTTHVHMTVQSTSISALCSERLQEPHFQVNL